MARVDSGRGAPALPGALLEALLEAHILPAHLHRGEAGKIGLAEEGLVEALGDGALDTADLLAVHRHLVERDRLSAHRPRRAGADHLELAFGKGDVQAT